jgi:signal transduction histidine kinase
MQEEQNFQRLQALVELQEHFYTRRGVELHDKVAQLLGSVNMLLGVAMKDIQQLADTVKVAQASLSTAIQELRALSKPMQEEWMSGFDMLEHLQHEITRINAAGGVYIALISSLPMPAIPGEKQAILFCVLLEALQTINRHAQPGKIVISISCKQQVEVVISDDGPKPYFLPESIRERVRTLKGGLRRAHTSAGNTMHIFLPV